MLNNKILKIVFKFLISFGLLLFLVWIMRDNIGGILTILKNSNKFYFAMALSISIPLTFAISIRLKILMRGQKINLHTGYVIYLTFLGYFFNNFFPTSIGGDIAKAYYAYKKTNNRAGSYAAVIADRIMGFLAVVSFAVIGVVFVGKDFENKKIFWIVAFMISVLMAMAIMLFNKRTLAYISNAHAKKTVINSVIQKCIKLYEAMHSYKNQKALLLKTYLLGIVMQFFGVLSIYFFILSVGGDIHILKLFLIIPLVWTVSMLPSLNGLGVREGAFVYFLKNDIGKERAFSVSLLWLGLTILFSIIGGLFHIFYPAKEKGNLKNMSMEA